MFFNAPENPNRLKRMVYLLAAIILGVLLSLIFSAVIEIGYWRWLVIPGQGGSFSSADVFFPALRIGLSAFGGVGGFFLGRFWWWKVYIERSWARKYSAGENK